MEKLRTNKYDHSKDVYTAYAIQCTHTKRIYIGCTNNLKARIQAHMSELRRGYKIVGHMGKRKPGLWQEDYNQYGKDSFLYVLLEENIPFDKKKERESYYIEKYNATDPKKGYNIRTEKSAFNEIAWVREEGILQ